MRELRFVVAVFFTFLYLIIASRLPFSLSFHIPEGFIYIDCGTLEDSIDIYRGLSYKSDKYFIESGETKFITQEFSQNYSMQYGSLRSFPEGERNCYTIKLEEEGDDHDNTYLVRGVFVYGNYDGKNQTPIFDLYLGVNRWARVDSDAQFVEANYVPTTNYMQLCLINVGNGIPYISALEISRLESSIYPIPNGYLTSLWTRRDFGCSYSQNYSGKELKLWDFYIKHRYQIQDDDRVWVPVKSDELNSISTTEFIPTSSNDTFKVPQVVLATASLPKNSTTPLNYIFTPSESGLLFYFCLHFVEIEKHKDGQYREMRIVLNNDHIITPSIKLDYLKRQTICSDGINVTAQKNYLSISSTPNSKLPPILNALEVFYFTELTNSPTYLQDVNAIMDIKQSYKVRKNWQGDPCIPTSFIWDGLNCSNDPTSRIISLTLSKSKLTGEIVFSFSNLTKLESLDLSHNDLRGPIPEFFGQLLHLKLLNLTGNSLIGSVPETLLQKSKDGTLLLSVNENPELCLSLPCKEKKRFSIHVLGYIILIIVVFILIFSVILIIITRKRKRNLSTESNRKGALKPKNQQYHHFEVIRMTDNLKTIIGEGGFGKVYLGTLNDKTLVAVKLLSKTSKQGYKEFQAEAQLLMIVHHQNLVSLVGYCDEGDNKVLIYEYMANGNLQQHLSGRSVRFLNWTERLRIALDAAQGLEYLHNGCKPPILHRDMKTSNILLNEKMQAKIADFGLSRILASESVSHLSTTPAGTIGYIDPEIHTSGNFTRKSDVYSFGIVLFELITGEPAIIKNGECNVHIVRWIKTLIEEGNIENIVDSRLKGAIEHGSAWKVVELAISCTLSSSDQRPNISCVVMELTECLKMVQCRIQPISSENNENFSYASIGSESILSPR